MNNTEIEFAAWCDRCARRIGELDGELALAEANRLARELHAFERTRAMTPEAAAEFVAAQMARPERVRFERRAAAR